MFYHVHANKTENSSRFHNMTEKKNLGRMVKFNKPVMVLKEDKRRKIISVPSTHLTTHNSL